MTAVLAAVAAFAWRATRMPSPADGPIVLVSIDTLRADRLPAYGYSRIPTPAIDALAKDGVLFEHAYSHSPQTLPAHASILSGTLPFQHGVRDNIGFTVKQGGGTLPAWLHDRGFVTGGFVSAYVLRKETGIGQGFDLYDANLPPASPDKSIGQVQRRGEDTLAAAERWLTDRSSPRVFLFLHIYEPHKPYEPPARYAQYGPYDGEVAYADEIVGRLLDSLRSRSLYDRATIIFLADHGEGLGDHGEQEHGLFLYDESIRIPFIVKLPGSAGAGRRVSVPVQHIDVAPTLMDLIGAPRPAGLSGRSLRPLLENRAGFTEQGIYSEALYSRYHFGWSELFALTDSRYRLIHAPRDELYDLQQDPDEKRDVAAERQQARIAMRNALDRLLAGAPITAPAEVSAEDRERLQALGYVGGQAAVAANVAGGTLADPKDKIGVLERYRAATELAGRRQYRDAIALYKEILAEDPEMSDVWIQLAEVYVRSSAIADAVAAYKRVIALKPNDAGSLIGAASGLLRLGRLDEAKGHAEVAVSVAPAGAHELLAKIALARNDAATARKEAELAQQADPSLPLPLYVQGLLLYKAGKYEEALALFTQAEEQLKPRTLQITELQFYIADTLARLERYPQAEAHFKEEIRLFPNSTRARSSLAMMYRAIGRDADAERTVEDMLKAVPTEEGYALAEQIWTIVGEPGRAAAIRMRARARASNPNGSSGKR